MQLTPAAIDKLIKLNWDQLPLERAKVAYLIGTDYDFINNPKVCNLIFENCLDVESVHFSISEYQLLDPVVQNLLETDSDI